MPTPPILHADTRKAIEDLVRPMVRREVEVYEQHVMEQPPWVRAVKNYGVSMDNSSSNSPGLDFARYVRAVAAGNGNRGESLIYAKREYGNDSRVTKALAAGNAAGGGLLIAEDMADEVIDLLRPRSVIRKMNPTIVRPTKGTLVFPKIASGAAAGYVGENQDIPVDEAKFGQLVLVARKLAALTPVSNELLKYGADADVIIRDDLIQAIATTEDQYFLRGTGMENTPKGLRYWTAEANVLSSNGTTASNIEADFKDLIQALEGKDVPMLRPFWIMAPRSKNHLITLRDANGNLIYPELRNSNPTIHQFPVLVTNNIPTDLGAGSNETEVYLVDASEVVLGEVNAVEVEVSRDAAYTAAGSVVSAFVRDQTLVRAVLRHDIGVKHAEAVAVVSDVTWGS